MSVAPTLFRRATLSVAVVALALTASLAFAQPSPQALSLFQQGLSAFRQNNLPVAIQQFEKAVSTDPRFTDGWYNLGSVQYRAGNYAKASAAYQQVILLNPADHQARYNMALAQEQLGNTAQAIQTYQAIPASHAAYQPAQTRLQALGQQRDSSILQPGNNTATTANTTTPATSTPATSTGPKTAEAFATQLAGPTGMALGPAGELYVANFSKNTIVKVMPNGQRATVLEGKGLSGPIGLVRDTRTGDLLVANYLSGEVLRVPTRGGSASVLAKDLKKPYNLLLDSLSNTLYISEQETNRVSRIKL